MVVLCLFCFSIAYSVRPKSSRPRQTSEKDERVYLNNADFLSYDIYGDHPGAQFLRGNVSISHKGMSLTCDSAYLYEEANRFEAFGHVRILQGDTLSLHSDKAYYDGNSEMAHAWNNVVLTHRKSTLYCDTLDYDRMYGIADAYGSAGMKMVEGKDVLTADWGRYYSDDRHSEFYYNVVLTDDKGLRIDTDTLYYDNRTSLAHVLGQSIIHSGKSIVNTTDSYYDTRTKKSELMGRSTIFNEDRVITGDRLFQNETTGECEGYGHVIYRDSKNKNIMMGETLWYNEKKGYGFATDSAVVIDYSQKDTLYMHSDTIRIKTFNMKTDSTYREVYAYHHVRAYRKDVQAVCDSLVMYSKDSCASMFQDPVVWTNGSQLLGERINVFFNDSTLRYAEVLSQALSVEQMDDTIHYNQVASRDMYSYFVKGKLRQNWAVSNVQVVFYPQDDKDSTIIGLNYMETDTMKMYVTPEKKLEKIWSDAATGTLYPMTQIPPGKDLLPTFVWLEYMRPVSKEDIFVWRPKKKGMELKATKRRQAPKRE